MTGKKEVNIPAFAGMGILVMGIGVFLFGVRGVAEAVVWAMIFIYVVSVIGYAAAHLTGRLE